MNSKGKNKGKDEKITELKANTKCIQEKDKTLMVIISEQFSQRNCWILDGIKERANEYTDEIIVKTRSNKLGLELEEKYLNKIHRAGDRNRKSDKSLAIDDYGELFLRDGWSIKDIKLYFEPGPLSETALWQTSDTS